MDQFILIAFMFKKKIDIAGLSFKVDFIKDIGEIVLELLFDKGLLGDFKGIKIYLDIR